MLIDRLPRDNVRQLHQRVAQALEKRRPDSSGEIALHFDAAGESAEAYRWGQSAAKARSACTRTRPAELVSRARRAERDDAR